jgi:hypothetical protein
MATKKVATPEKVQRVTAEGTGTAIIKAKDQKVQPLGAASSPPVLAAHASKALTYMAAQLTNAGPEASALITEELYKVEAIIESLKETARRRLTALVVASGEVHTEAGSKRLVVGEWELEARVRDTGLDARKVEQMLRSKSKPPEAGMDAVVTYKVNPSKLLVCGLSEEEVNACKKEVSYTLQRPKRTGQEDAP